MVNLLASRKEKSRIRLYAKVGVEMARKKRCPDCGSKKVKKAGREWRCGTCGNTWSGKAKRSGSRKERTRFSG